MVKEFEVSDGTIDVEVNEVVGPINARLGSGEDVTNCRSLKASHDLCSVGYQIGHKYLYLNETQAAEFRKAGEGNLIRENLSTAHITQRRARRYVIDAFGFGEHELREKFPYCYQHITVGGNDRAGLVSDASDKTWWQFQRTRDDFRKALVGLDRLIARPITAKHHIGLVTVSCRSLESITLIQGDRRDDEAYRRF